MFVHANLFHLGPLHLSVFSAFAAVGLVASLLLGVRTGPMAGISGEAMWDMGMAGAVFAFLISRALLVATNFKDFLRFPVLVLSLPSLSVSGVLLTLLVVWAMARRKKLMVARVLDAAAPCCALLWAVLSLGVFATGSSGMPTGMPWGVEDRLLGRIHPVEVYGALAALVLCWLLVKALPKQKAPGQTVSTGLFVAGGMVFFLDFVAQPADGMRIVLLDPVEWLGLGMIIVGFFGLLPRLRFGPVQKTAGQEGDVHAV